MKKLLLIAFSFYFMFCCYFYVVARQVVPQDVGGHEFGTVTRPWGTGAFVVVTATNINADTFTGGTFAGTHTGDGGGLTNVGLAVFSEYEMSLESNVQAFADDTWVAITNWQEAFTGVDFAGTHSNILVLTDGDFHIHGDFSWESDGAADALLRVFTNHVLAVDASGNGIGFRRTIALNTWGCASFQRMLTLSSNTVVSVRIYNSAGADDFTWDNAAFGMHKE